MAKGKTVKNITDFVYLSLNLSETVSLTIYHPYFMIEFIDIAYFL